jgi:hypothetical protein
MDFGSPSLKISSLAAGTMTKCLCFVDANEVEFLYSHTEISGDSDIDVTHD